MGAYTHFSGNHIFTEYYGRNEALEISSRIKKLEEAVSIADEVLNKIEYFGISMGTRNAIIVESANSKTSPVSAKGNK